MAKTFRNHAAQVTCKSGGGVMLSSYSGPLCVTSFDKLRARVIESSAGEECLVLRMDKSTTLMMHTPKIPNGTYHPNKSAPGALIVRDDQYKLWSSYADSMADIGIRRVVFRDSQLALCREWVDSILGYAPRERSLNTRQLPVF